MNIVYPNQTSQKYYALLSLTSSIETQCKNVILSTSQDPPPGPPESEKMFEESKEIEKKEKTEKSDNEDGIGKKSKKQDFFESLKNSENGEMNQFYQQLVQENKFLNNEGLSENIWPQTIKSTIPTIPYEFAESESKVKLKKIEDQMEEEID